MPVLSSPLVTAPAIQAHLGLIKVCADHLAQNCHDTSRCPICRADSLGYGTGYKAGYKDVAEQ